MQKSRKIMKFHEKNFQLNIKNNWINKNHYHYTLFYAELSHLQSSFIHLWKKNFLTSKDHDFPKKKCSWCRIIKVFYFIFWILTYNKKKFFHRYGLETRHNISSNNYYKIVYVMTVSGTLSPQQWQWTLSGSFSFFGSPLSPYFFLTLTADVSLDSLFYLFTNTFVRKRKQTWLESELLLYTLYVYILTYMHLIA